MPVLSIQLCQLPLPQLQLMHKLLHFRGELTGGNSGVLLQEAHLRCVRRLHLLNQALVSLLHHPHLALVLLLDQILLAHVDVGDPLKLPLAQLG